LIHVAVAGGDVGDPVVPVPEGVNGEPLGGRDVGDRPGHDREDEDVLVQDVVVLDVRARSASGAVALPRLRRAGADVAEYDPQGAKC
jgi:hypothetical protein